MFLITREPSPLLHVIKASGTRITIPVPVSQEASNWVINEWGTVPQGNYISLTYGDSGRWETLIFDGATWKRKTGPLTSPLQGQWESGNTLVVTKGKAKWSISGRTLRDHSLWFMPINTATGEVAGMIPVEAGGSYLVIFRRDAARVLKFKDMSLEPGHVH